MTVRRNIQQGRTQKGNAGITAAAIVKYNRGGRSPS